MKTCTNEKRILCVGEILWDMLPTGAKEGGAPMNVALHLKKFGISSLFAGKIGNDPLGESLNDFLIRKGMDTSLLQVDKKFATSTVEVTLKPNQEVVFDIVDNVAWDNLELTNELLDASNGVDAILYGTLASRHEQTYGTIISLLKGEFIKVIDVNLRPPYCDMNVVESLIAMANIAKLNDAELKIISGWHDVDDDEIVQAKWFAQYYQCDHVCITKGAYGAFLYDAKTDIIYRHPGYKVKVEDTVGSGDAFLAGFLYKYFSNEPLDKALEFACATGALVATKAGGTPDYSIAEIEKLMS